MVWRKDRVITLKFRAENRDIFEAIKSGAKKVETRAATKKYEDIKVGDIVKLSCGGDSFEKLVTKVTIFPTIDALLETYTPQEINPKIDSAEKLTEMYYSFPGYREKIEKIGLVALELK